MTDFDSLLSQAGIGPMMSVLGSGRPLHRVLAGSPHAGECVMSAAWYEDPLLEVIMNGRPVDALPPVPAATPAADVEEAI